MNTLHPRKLLTGTMALSLVLSGCLLAGNHTASASGSAGFSRQGLAVEHYAALQELTSRWRKQSEEFRKGGMPILEEASTLLGMDKEQLIQELSSGKSILEVAAARGFTEAELTDKLIASRSAKLDEAVQAGKLTKERADTIRSKMRSHITYKLKQKGLDSKDGKVRHGRGGGLLHTLGPAKLSSMLGITQEELMSGLKSGRSLAEIAKEKGISKEELVAKLKEELTPALEQSVDRKLPKQNNH